MKRLLTFLVLINIIIFSDFSLPVFTAEPGGTKTWMAYFYVTDQDGNPLADIDLELMVTTWYGDELDPDYKISFAYGTTLSDGYGYLECVIPGELAEGLESMWAYMREPDYATLSSQNTHTYSSQAIWPQFTIFHDADGNGISDEWELPLAQQFCPTLVLQSGDNGVRPVPVESMDRNGDGVLGWEDILVRTFNIAGNLVGEFEMDELLIHGGGNPYLYTAHYPRLASSEQRVAQPDVNGNGVFGDSGEPVGVYFFVPHYEWGTIGDTNLLSWYNSWLSFIQAHGSESEYVDGTTYAHLFINGNETVIQYWFYYPFNHSANRHEGDWEHINVVLDSQDPNTANIIRVEYYFHGSVTPRYTPGVDYYLVSGTHPKVYVGGYTDEGGFDGHGTHGSYPFDGVWPEINILNTNETVDGLGLTIDFANYQNIIIMPKVDAVDIGTSLEWMQFAALWGHPLSFPSAGDNLGTSLFDISFDIASNIPWGQPWLTILGVGVWDAYTAAGYSLIQETKMAPLGPPAKANTWEKVYNQTNLTIYTKR